MSSIPPILLLLLVILLSPHVTAQPPTIPTYASTDCGFNEEANSVYKSNIKTILAELQDHALTESYYNTSVGTGGDKVYGQYYCRGDIDSNLCGRCIQQASNEQDMKSSYCSSFKSAAIYYLECTLCYANYSTVGTLVDPEFSAVPYYRSEFSVSDPDKFAPVLINTTDRIRSEAAYSQNRFATGEGTVSPSETLYCLMQCSPDLSATQCDSCLQFATTADLQYKIDSGNQWAKWASVFYPNCQLMYNTQAVFYTMTNTTVPPAGSSHPPQLPPVVKGKRESNYYVVRAAIPAAVVGSLMIILGISFCLIRHRTVNKPTTEVGAVEPEEQTTDCVQFDLKTIETATNSFSVANKLGQGGFGIVYQGILQDGQDIAVKRLSSNSGQGTKEFKTEVAVVAKLQHKNLVQLVGCCAVGEERLLVYEFLRNLSLDRFLFDESRSSYLTWEIRHKIIQGIARGLHYLHQDSRVKILHRDLKTSNILLDDNMDPKIADFGLARLVKVDQTSSNTTKVVGTYGYMAPEYAIAGRYSTKSDVYSFGVIVLEILSGKQNSQFYEIFHGEGFLLHAWRVWNEGTIEQIIDPILQNNFSRIEAERYLQIGLLCVQDDETNRPTMHAVLVMLNSNTIDLAPPFPPSHSYYINNHLVGDDTDQQGPNKQKVHESYGSSVAMSAQTNLSGR